ncbi:Inner membrane ABC transporter permease protein YejE [Planctomycetes bacterium Pan216]|uniref:Inner membrane ABC transporter permease protein YejE n=1 Tax=Kolteria novifilia TaxID=2527975 RepID=A0A518B7K3_9BACT|nr:Inner membrane ABC transporter permease protein YejE [Planctomycetes bacterium Pan216]
MKTLSDAPSEPSESLLKRRLRRFRGLRRGYYSFLILVTAYLLSFGLPFVMGRQALVVHYDSQWYFPAFRSYFYNTFGIGNRGLYLAKTFEQTDAEGKRVLGQADYAALKKQFAKQDNGNFVLMPLIPFGPNQQSLDQKGNPPYPPSWQHWLGTDDRGRDILVRLAYGFRISISFALVVTGISYMVGIAVGATLGYYGRWVDMLGLRFVEIWGSIPFLYTVIILASLLPRTFGLLAGILATFGWMGITYYIRGEVYRERSKDYVAAAIAVGEGHTSIIFRHILPNSLTPVISFAPFAIVANITSLVALDFLGYGLPPPTPSWGELIGQGKENIRDWHLVVFPLVAMFLTLQLIVFIGEAVREALDPKTYSRLR